MLARPHLVWMLLLLFAWCNQAQSARVAEAIKNNGLVGQTIVLMEPDIEPTGGSSSRQPRNARRLEHSRT